MNDDRVVKLLEEIRDLQRQHVENYKEGLRNQRESVELSRQWHEQASRRLRVTMIVLTALVALYALLQFLPRR
jgi:hypothetical protein